MKALRAIWVQVLSRHTCPACLSRNLEFQDLQSFRITIAQAKECLACEHAWESHPKEIVRWQPSTPS